MEPIKFKGANCVYGEGQPEYLPLPARLDKEGNVLSCWRLSREELERINETGIIWISQKTFFQPLQPILPLVSGTVSDDPLEISVEQIKDLINE